MKIGDFRRFSKLRGEPKRAPPKTPKIAEIPGKIARNRQIPAISNTDKPELTSRFPTLHPTAPGRRFRLADNPDFASWLKSMVDAAATSRTVAPVCLVFVGLEDRFRRMVDHNPSVGRVFDPMIDIHPWTQSESEEFFRTAFAKLDCRISDHGLRLLVMYTDGLPVMAHASGQSVLEFAENEDISFDAIRQGLFHAAESMGRRFLNKQVIQALQSENYRSILRKIVDYETSRIGSEFSRKQLRSLRALTPAEKRGLDNFLTRMRQLGALVPSPGGERGAYRFATHMHRIYFVIEARRAKQA